MNSFLKTAAEFMLQNAIPALEKSSPAVKNIVGAVITYEMGSPVVLELPWGLGPLVVQKAAPAQPVPPVPPVPPSEPVPPAPEPQPLAPVPPVPSPSTPPASAGPLPQIPMG